MSMLASETAASAPGSGLVVNRLADMLFIHSIRAHIASHTEDCKNGLLLRSSIHRSDRLSDPCTRKWKPPGQSNRWQLSRVCRVPHLRFVLRNWLEKHRWNI